MADAVLSDINPVKLPFLNAPYLPDPNFIARNSLLERISETVKDNKPVVLRGVAGTGKTHLAVHSAYDIRAEAQEQGREIRILWINACSAYNIIASLLTIATQLDLPVIEEPRSNPCEIVSEWLQAELNRTPCIRFIIILDGLESCDLLSKPLRLEAKFLKHSEPVQKYKSLKSYLLLERKDDTQLMITTRSAAVAEAFETKSVTVGDLNDSEIQSLCKQVIGDRATADTGAALSGELGKTALVIRMAAGCLKYAGCDPQTCLTAVASSKQILSSAEPPINFPPALRLSKSKPNDPNVLAAVINTMFKTLLGDYKHLEDVPNAYDRLCFMIGMGGQNIPLWEMHKLTPTEEFFESPAHKLLMTLGFMNQSAPGTFTVCSVIQQAFWTCNKDFYEAAMTDAMSMLTTFFTRKRSQSRGFAHALLPWTELILTYSAPKPEARAELLGKRSGHYLSLNFYEEAWRDANGAYQIHRDRYGDDADNVELVASLHSVGQVAYNMGNYELAEQIHRMALDKAEALTNAGAHDLKHHCTTDLALTVNRLGKHQESADLYRKAITDRDQTQRDDIEFWLDTADLGTQLCHLGQIDEAFDMQEQAYTELVRLSGERSTQTRHALHMWIATLSKQEKWMVAIEKLRYLIHLEEECQGPHAYGTLADVSMLGELLYRVGNKEESHQCYRRALGGYTARIGPDHPQTKSVKHNYEYLFRELLVTV